MNEVCDNKSVGVMIARDRDLAVIKRKNYPQAYALPAGHLDGDDFMEAAVRETKEEVGLIVHRATTCWEGEIYNPCKRRNGFKHQWRVFSASAHSYELRTGDDASEAFWADLDYIRDLARKTEYFMHRFKIEWHEVNELTRAIFGDPTNPNTDPEWLETMGLEPVWYYILRSQPNLKII